MAWTGCAPAGRSSPAALAIVGVTVVDVDRGTRVENQSVVMQGDSIVAIGPAGSVRVPAGAREVRGAGKFLIPGLWDMHVHLSMAGREALPLFLANGVTGVRDLGGDPITLRWRDSIAAGTLLGPRVKAAGIIVEHAGWLARILPVVRSQNLPAGELERRFAVGSPNDAERAVDSLARLGADLIKVRNHPPPDAWFTLLRAARRRGLPVAAHAPEMASIAATLDSGVTSLEHFALARSGGALVEGFSSLTPDARRDLYARFGRTGTALAPTFVSALSRLISDSALARIIEDTLGLGDSRLRRVGPTLRATWREMLRQRQGAPDGINWEPIQRAAERQVREASDAGVLIVAGTDMPVPPLMPGYSLIDELELLVRDVHLSPLQALQTATINAAKAQRLEGRSGRVAVGYHADLVLLDGDPLQDISALRRIHMVVARGRPHQRQAIDCWLRPR
jgi:cytosine/adenosine deaminase-related metal-dependent hydrolase